MHDDVHALTDRERETLRLLLAGHDAKSIARRLGLSVHTINERLRDARRKLGLSSSREAARRLADAERTDPDFVGDKRLGVPVEARRQPHAARIEGGWHSIHRLVWFGGGMVMMSLMVAAVVLSSGFRAGDAPDPRGAPAAAAVAHGEAQSVAIEAARKWVALLDEARWQESWDQAANLFRSQISAAQWATKVGSVRQPLGAVSERAIGSVTHATSLPGAPDGDYVLIEFKTRFEHKPDAIETTVLARDNAGWKVTGISFAEFGCRRRCALSARPSPRRPYI